MRLHSITRIIRSRYSSVISVYSVVNHPGREHMPRRACSINPELALRAPFGHHLPSLAGSAAGSSDLSAGAFSLAAFWALLLRRPKYDLIAS